MGPNKWHSNCIWIGKLEIEQRIIKQNEKWIIKEVEKMKTPKALKIINIFSLIIRGMLGQT